MDFVAYNEIMICNTPICNVPVSGVVIGYEFRIKYPSYRGCFLNCIEELYFEVDGQRLSETEVFFCLNGKQLRSENFRNCSGNTGLSGILQ